MTHEEDLNEIELTRVSNALDALESHSQLPTKSAWEAIMEEMKINTEHKGRNIRVISIASAAAVVLIASVSMFAIFASTGSSSKVRTADTKTTEPIETSTTVTTEPTTVPTSLPPETTTTVPSVKMPGTVLSEQEFGGVTYVLSIVDLGQCNPINCGGFTYDENGTETDQSTNDLIFVATNKSTGENLWQTDRINATGFTSEIQWAKFGATQYLMNGQGSVHAMPSEYNNQRTFAYDANTKEWTFGD